MLALTLVLACSGPPQPVDCPEGDPVGGATPAGEAGWWQLADPGVVGLERAWPFRAREPMGSGDEAWWCEGGGPTWQRHGAAGEVSGHLDAALVPTGQWVATWTNTGATALTGRYADGVPAGTWVFSDPTGREVARGGFAVGRPHGPWTVVDVDRQTEARYVFGTRHGEWVETLPDGSRVEGHYFNGRKNYEWDFLGADGVVERREAWKYGTHVVSWDPRAEANPLPDRQLPADLGPDAQGICKVHATCATNAFLTVMLTGTAVTADEALGVPVLVDFADASAPPESFERVVLVDEYTIEEVVAGVGAKDATARIRFDARCLVGEGGVPQPLEGEEVLEIHLHDRDGVWKLGSPLRTVYVRVDAWAERHPERAAEVNRVCGGAE